MHRRYEYGVDRGAKVRVPVRRLRDRDVACVVRYTGAHDLRLRCRLDPRGLCPERPGVLLTVERATTAAGSGSD